MKFAKLSDQELETKIQSAVIEEKKAQTHVLHLLAEVERRRLYSKEYPSLFEYCVRVLRYSSGSAQRRIDTMRAMKLIPEIETKIISGELNLTSISQAQTFWRHEAKQDKKYSVDQKIELLQKLENKSTRECTETLIAISPESVPQERRREITIEKTELRVCLNKELIEKFDKIKALFSNKFPHMSDAELLTEMAEITLQKLDPCRKTTSDYRKSSLNPLPALEVKTHRGSKTDSSLYPSTKANLKSHRYIPTQLRRAVWQRDGGKCTYKSCNSKHFLEIDHIEPLALGGTNDTSNLRLLCRTHNQRVAVTAFGAKHMEQFI